MEDRLSELLAKLDKMRDAQVALQEKLASAKQRMPGEDPGGAEAGDPTEGDPAEGGQGDGNKASGAGVSSVGVDPVARDHHHQTSVVDSSLSSSAFSGQGLSGSGSQPMGQGDVFSMYGMKRETLLVAAENGDLKSLKSVISDWKDDSYLMNESLYAAASKGNYQCALVLAENGADCKYWHSPDDETVLSTSAANGHVSLMELLLGKGVDVNQAVSGDKHTALHAAASHGETECARFLIDSGCDLNAKDTFGMTPLMVACKDGHVDVVKLLLEAKADPALKTRVRKETAFVLAFNADQAECVQEMLTASPEEAKTPLKGGLLPLHHAIRHGKDPVVCAMVDAGVDLNLPDGPWTPIHLAVEMGNIPIVGILAACGADLNAHLPVPKKVTILMLSVCKENPEMVRAIGSQASCNLNQFDELGRTALYLAVKFGYVKCVEVLLEICADVDAYAAHMVQERNAGDTSVSLPAPTALHAAILNDHPDVASLLIAGGCQTDMGAIFEEDGITNVFKPLHVACLKRSQWAVDMLLDAGTPVPDGFIAWCKNSGIDAGMTAHIEDAVTNQKKNPSMLKKS